VDYKCNNSESTVKVNRWTSLHLRLKYAVFFSLRDL